MMQSLKAIRVEVGAGWNVAIAAQNAAGVGDLKNGTSWEYLGDRVFGITDTENNDAILCEPTASDKRWGRWLILQETKEYRWEIWNETAAINYGIKPLSGLVGHKGWKPNYFSDRCAGTFQLVNFCGRAFLASESHPDCRLEFEIEPKKFSLTEYQVLAETLQEEVGQLLVDWATPTSLWREAFGADEALLAEKFADLSNGIGAEKIQDALDQICINPHRLLETETRWVPAGAASPALFASDPMRHGRDWDRIGGRIIPAEIEEERKYDTFDTCPNRFIKFALGDFLAICEATVENSSENSAIRLEANRLREWIEETLDNPFFEEVGEMELIPFDNPTLQDREGYKQILEWWLRLASSGKVAWDGREDLYQAPDRSLDKLYEYWIYLELRRMLLSEKEEGGLEMEELPLDGQQGKRESGLRSLVAIEKGDGTETLRINLQQGKETLSCYRWKPDQSGLGGVSGDTWRIHLYYNRGFSLSEDPRRPGSYSARFRPDYTIMTFPDPAPESKATEIKSALKAEQDAEARHEATYWHFDAKYRFDEVFTEVFGLKENVVQGETLSEDKAEKEDREEKEQIKAEGKFKRADLFKMHAYNDAIRRTAGSYVLYPGDKNKAFKKFHEIIPGIGAFVLKPSVGQTIRPSIEVAKFLREAMDMRRRQGSNLNAVRASEYFIAHGLEFSGIEESNPS